MITRFQLIRNVGKFDSAVGDGSTDLAKTTLIYGENGRGKTTLSALLRSLSDGGPLPIAERHRFGSQHPPHVVIHADTVPAQLIFESGAWNATLPDLAIYDDRFVDENVYSGLAVETEHRQNMHELILGRQGIALNEQLQTYVQRIEEHNRELRARAEPLVTLRGALSVEEYCDIIQRPHINQEILETERTLAAISEATAISSMPLLDVITLPELDIADISAVLSASIDSLDALALERLHEHFSTIGEAGEPWVADGMRRLALRDGTPMEHDCPFCNQKTDNSAIIGDYLIYFGENYARLVSGIERINEVVRRALTEIEMGALFQRAQQTSERALFWSRFCDLPAVPWPSNEEVTRIWRDVLNDLSTAIRLKRERPTEPLRLPQAGHDALERFQQLGRQFAEAGVVAQRANAEINIVKERARGGDVDAVRRDLANLRMLKARFEEPALAYCAAYREEVRAKAVTEDFRNAARQALDDYRQGVFPAYETAINIYLQRFNAGYRVGSVTSINTRAGSACTYSVVLNNHSIAVGAAPQEGQPSFRNVLSTGDRTTLALAFFFASLDQRPNLPSTIVLVDDPIASMDSNRTLTTVQEMRRLSGRVAQLILMSHDKPFLCNVWDGIDRTRRAALMVTREADGSTIRKWDVTRDAVTEHDRRHELLREHLQVANPEPRQVAESLRHVLEGFVRVAYPDHFEPDKVLGHFQREAERLMGLGGAPLSRADLNELNDLMEYANRFHHDTNQAWATAAINDAELVHFTQRTLAFTRRP